MVIALTAGVALGLLIVAVCARSGLRGVFAPFRINPRRMTVERLGLGVEGAENVERVDGILGHFLGGFNATITARSIADAMAKCDAVPVLYRPFAEEGLAMGYTLHRFLRYDPKGFESAVVRPRPEFRYLYYVGLGFWSGMRRHSAAQVERVAQDLDPLHRYLCFDGYGFKRAFFDLPKSEQGLRPLDSLQGYARNAAYQGVGRALYFLHMDQPKSLVSRIRSLGDYANDAAAGVGLAMAFVNPDRLDRVFAAARALPAEWHRHVHLGLCFGLKARSINDLSEFEKNLSALSSDVRHAVWSSIRECDRVELLVRAESGSDRYRMWRERVTAWMEANIDYPLQRAQSSTSAVRGVERVGVPGVYPMNPVSVLGSGQG